MKPRDLLHARIDEYLLAPMEEAGFTYSKSQRSFKRKVGGFTQVMDFSLGKYNHENFCRFVMNFRVESREYARWYDETWGTSVSEPLIWATSYWSIPNWPRKPKEILFGLVTLKNKGAPWRFLLRNTDEDAAEMTVLREALLGPAVTKLDQVTSFEGAAQDLWNSDLHRIADACDLFIIAGQTDKAREVIEDGISKAKKAKIIATPQIIADLEKRRDKFFATP